MSIPAIDPTFKFTDITIGETTYKMAFDLGSLADAEAAINKSGGDVNLLSALDFSNLSLRGVQQLFACTLRKAQPDITYENAKALVTIKTLYPICNALYSAWLESVGADENESPNGQTPIPVVTESEQKNSPESNSGATSGPSPDTTST